MAELLFVYGTLRPALWPEALRPLLQPLSCVGSGSVYGRLYDFGPHPAAILDPHVSRRIMGEVLALPGENDLLKHLDDYEGYDAANQEASSFVRVKCRVRMNTGGELTCWMYVYNRDPGTAVIVPHGDYLLWRQQAEL